MAACSANPPARRRASRTTRTGPRCAPRSPRARAAACGTAAPWARGSSTSRDGRTRGAGGAWCGSPCRSRRSPRGWQPCGGCSSSGSQAPRCSGSRRLSRRMLRRIQRLVAFARRLAAGEAPPYLAAERADDLGLLEAQLGEMARSVAATIAALRVEQERLEAILRGMVEGVVVTDLAGDVVLMNARARDLLGVPAGTDGRGRPLVELARDPALAEIPRELGAAAETVSRDVTLAGGDGPTLQVNAARLHGADGAPFGFVLVLHDVSELRRLEVIRRDFVANVSHELRTPLTAIKGYAETLLGPAGDDRETARRFLAVIDRHSERLGRLIDDLLTLSDLELGRTPLRLAAVPVGPVLDDVLQILAARIAAGGIEVTAQVAPGTPPVKADGDRLRQVLINLVDNAIKYTPRGGTVGVRAGPAAVPEAVEIAVEDTGVGIPAQAL